jgi:small subunit ribosomal protein S19
MAKKENVWRGKTAEEVKNMDMNEFITLLGSRERRKLTRGLTEAEKVLLNKIEKGKKNIETHCRDMVITPIMLGKTIKIYSGKEFIPLIVDLDMMGHRLGEFALTRKLLAHSAPGIGATRSSSAISVK